MDHTLLTLVTGLATAGLAFAFGFPQFFRVRRTGSAEGVSLASVTNSLVSTTAWLLYGFSLQDVWVITTSLVGLPAIIATIHVVRRAKDDHTGMWMPVVYTALLAATALLIPVAVAIAPVRVDLAAAGTVVALLAALTTNWYFVGLARPYLLLALETIPRLAFTVVGIAVMQNGADAIAGLSWQSGGLVVAFLASTWWILHSLRAGGSVTARAPRLRQLLVDHGHGVGRDVGLLEEGRGGSDAAFQ